MCLKKKKHAVHKNCVAQEGTKVMSCIPGLSHFSMELRQAGEMGFEALLLGRNEKHLRVFLALVRAASWI